MARGDKLKTIYAFLATNPRTLEEGIVGELISEAWFPYVTADLKFVERLKPRAKMIEQQTQNEVRLVRFIRCEERIDDVH